MKVLLIGSDGQLGLEFQKISNSYDSLSWVFSTIKTLDLLKLDTINTFLNDINPSVIINCAAYTSVGKAEIESELADIINHKAVDTISRWTSDNNKKLIHFSTDYVFDGLSNIPLSENSKTNPVNEYGRSKLKGEQVCLKNDANSIVIRTSWLYSSFGKNFVKTMIDLMKKNKSVKVVNDQIGVPTSADFIVSHITDLIINSRLTEQNCNQIYHLSPHGCASWYEFAVNINNYQNIACDIIPTTSHCNIRKARRPSNSKLSADKFISTFGVDIKNWEFYYKELITNI